jgi:hypothetical protein
LKKPKSIISDELDKYLLKNLPKRLQPQETKWSGERRTLIIRLKSRTGSSFVKQKMMWVSIELRKLSQRI